MRTYVSSRVKKKSFYKKSELQMFLKNDVKNELFHYFTSFQMFLFISGGHVGGKLYKRCVKCFDKKLKKREPQRPKI